MRADLPLFRLHVDLLDSNPILHILLGHIRHLVICSTSSALSAMMRRCDERLPARLRPSSSNLIHGSYTVER
jgi:hypothetical protein